MAITVRPDGFNSVHLPLVYKISNTKFPINSVDSVVSVTSGGAEYGYWRIDTSADIKVGIQPLDYVLLTVNGVQEVHQVIKVYADDSVIVDVKSETISAPLPITDAQFYYNNYHTNIKIYAGLRSAHTLNASKPTRLITSINLVPGSDNDTVININEFLKTDINILSNNFSLSSLQNDIDAFTEFYIEYAESYDTSDGSLISTYISSYTSDVANYGVAVNSKLPFKNGNGGRMSQYEEGNDFLTTFEYPVLFNGYYYDIFLLRGLYGPSNLTVERYKDGILQTTDTISIDSKDEGVYRIPLTVSADEDQLQINAGGEIKTIDVNSNCSNQSIYLTWLNYLGGMDYWLFTAQKEYGVDIEDVQQTEVNLFINWPDSYDGNRIKYDTKRTSRENILVRSQNLTLEQVQGLKYIKTSPLVQIHYNDNNNTTKNVLVDNSSFTVYSESDKLYTISFTISMTDQVPSQSL